MAKLARLKLPHTLSHGKESVAMSIIFTALFLDFFGIGLTIPTLTPLVKDPASGLFHDPGSEMFRDTIYLLISSCFFIGSFFGAPVIGMMADKLGRRPLIIFTSFFTMLSTGIVLIGIVSKIPSFLFFGRLVAGLLSGMLIVLQSSIADISEDHTKAKRFGMIGIAFGLGFSIGPIMGSLLSDPSYHPMFGYYLPYLIATILNAFNFVFIFIYYPETIKLLNERKVNYLKGLHNIKVAASQESTRMLFLIILILATGFSLFIQYFQAYLINRFHFTKLEQGISLLYIGIWIAISQGLILRQILKKIGPMSILAFSIPMMGVGFLALNFATDYIQFFCFAPILALAQGLTFPSILSILSNSVAKDKQGEILGINQSVQALSSSMPLVLGVVAASYEWFTLLFGAACAIVGSILFLFQFKALKRDLSNTD